MRLKYLTILFFAAITSFTSNAQPSQNFKIVGYYPFDEALKVDTTQVPFDRLTHIMLAFVNPDSLGNFSDDFSALAPFLKAAHNHRVKVLYSIGGGSYVAQYHTLLKHGKRQELVKSFVSHTVQFDVDGIDVDLEEGYAFGRNLDPNYGIFIKELAQALKAKNKLITAALPSQPGNSVSHEVLTQFDFINVMSYDHTGPWTPDRAENHASYSAAMDDLRFSTTTKFYSFKERLLLFETNSKQR